MIPDNWKSILSQEELVTLDSICSKVEEERNLQSIFPSASNVFRVFELIDLADVKVVILGQDPYHGDDQADGLAFSVQNGIKLPPSLRNIFVEFESDLKMSKITGNLTSWSEQGVFLLNSILSVRKAQPGSHKELGWEWFTNLIIKRISEYNKNIVFVLWGAYAQKKESLISSSNEHLVLKSVHPSPLSSYRGFFGSRPFSQINVFLEQHNIQAIKWDK